MSEAALPRNNVRVVGAGKQTIIFAHGFGTDQTAWRHQEAALAKQFRLVLFDHVGAGRADSAAYSPRRYKGLHNYASDLLEIYAALHLTDTVYVGHSMGGMIGLLAGIAQPRLFRKMIFVGASPCYLTEPGYTGGFDQASLDGLYAAMASNYHAWASGFAGLAMGNPERPELSAEFARRRRPDHLPVGLPGRAAEAEGAHPHRPVDRGHSRAARSGAISRGAHSSRDAAGHRRARPPAALERTRGRD
jgi:sigma-B regulation protein RsbQ